MVRRELFTGPVSLWADEKGGLAGLGKEMEEGYFEQAFRPGRTNQAAPRDLSRRRANKAAAKPMQPITSELGSGTAPPTALT